jgi:hypothetical protein
MYSGVEKQNVNKMHDARLNVSGLNDHLIQAVTGSFNLLNKNGDVKIISDENDIQSLLAELAASGVNVFSKNSELVNVFQVNDLFIIQIKTLVYLQRNYRYLRGNLDVTNYFLFQIGYKKLKHDYGIIHIEPIETQENYVVKLLSHIFSSDDLVINEHKRFTDKYHIHATDKQQANSLISNRVLDAISDYNDLHISIAHDKLIIGASELNTNSTIAIIKIVGTLSD